MGKFAFGLFMILLIFKAIGFGISWFIVFLPLIIILVAILASTIILGFVAWLLNKLG